MNLANAYDYYLRNSTSASERVRQLALAALGVIWIYKVDGAGGPSVPDDLALPALLSVIALALDFLQYVFATAFWGAFRRLKEKKLMKLEGDPTTREFAAPKWINWAALGFFWLKVPALMTAYYFLVHYLVIVWWRAV